MNFSPFTTQFGGLQANTSLHQFTTAKFAQNLTTSNGQVNSKWKHISEESKTHYDYAFGSKLGCESIVGDRWKRAIFSTC